MIGNAPACARAIPSASAASDRPVSCPTSLSRSLIFGLTMSITPGPNVIMIAASRVNFGWRRSIPLYFGVVLGFMSLLLAVGFGLGAVFDRYPAIRNLLRYTGAAYLIWLAFRIATSGRKKTADPDQGMDAGRRPFSFLQGAALHGSIPRARSWPSARCRSSPFPTGQWRRRCF
ncbi:MAG: LysE family translocator [Rhodospirillaceae bacterium]|nr:LysE family translocator [Rhodospirillaceae bacterium]